MARLAAQLRRWLEYKVASNPDWQSIQVHPPLLITVGLLHETVCWVQWPLLHALVCNVSVSMLMGVLSLLKCYQLRDIKHPQVA